MRKRLMWSPILLFAALAIPQTQPRMSPPPPSLDPERTPSADQGPSLPRHHIDIEQLRHEADDLARTAQTIPADVTTVRQGMLPKDMIQKLKQIEKLAKHMRGQLTP